MKYRLVCCLAQCPGVHPDEFVPQFGNTFTGIDSPSITDNANITNIVWPVKKLANENTGKPLQNSEKNVRLMSCLVQLFTPGKRGILDSYAGTMTVAHAAAGTNRKCLCIEKGSICFKKAVGRNWKLSQSFQENSLVDSVQNNKNVNIEEIVRRMCDGTDDCFESGEESDRLNNLDANTLDTGNDTRDGSSRKSQLRTWSTDENFAEIAGFRNEEIVECLLDLCSSDETMPPPKRQMKMH